MKQRWTLLVTFLAFAIYLRTLSPSLSWGDSAELTGAAFQGGVPHATGYPLYMLIAHPVLHLGSLPGVPYRMNLLSAISAAISVGLLMLFLRRLGIRAYAAAAAALTFAFSLTFWSQAVITEVYAFHLALTVGVLLCATSWDRTGKRQWLRGTALLYGLCFTHHLMSVLLAPALLVLGLTSRHRQQLLRDLPVCAMLLLAPLALYGTLPLAARRSPHFDAGDVRTWQNLLDHVTGARFRGQMFQLTPSRLARGWARYAQWPPRGENGLLWQQVPQPFLVLVLPGLWQLGRRNRRWLLVSALLFVVSLVYALGYDIPDIEAYYLVCHLVVAVWMAFGLQQVWSWLVRAVPRAPGRLIRKRLGLAGAVGLFLLPATVLTANWRANDKSRDWSAVDYARTVLAVLKPNTLLLVGGGMAYDPVLYLHYVERQRPDIDALDWWDMAHPELLHLTTRRASDRLSIQVPAGFPTGLRGAHPNNGLLRQVVADNIGHRPVCLYYVDPPSRLLRTSTVAEALRGYFARCTTNLTLLELYPTPASPTQPSGSSAAARFVLRDAGGRERPVVEFRGYSVAEQHAPGAQWWRVHYSWGVRDRALAQRTQVRVVLADKRGKPRTDLDDWFVGAHSLHWLGQFVGPDRPPLADAVDETFDVYLPRAERGRPLDISLALQVDGQPLWVEGSQTNLFRIGSLQQ